MQPANLSPATDARREQSPLAVLIWDLAPEHRDEKIRALGLPLIEQPPGGPDLYLAERVFEHLRTPIEGTAYCSLAGWCRIDDSLCRLPADKAAWSSGIGICMLRASGIRSLNQWSSAHIKVIHHWLRPLLYILALVLAGFDAKRLNGNYPDDAYISFRYALHLSDGQGWVYNVGSSTGNGATSPLHVLLLALGYRFHPDMMDIATVLFVITMAAAACITAEIFTSIGEAVTGIIAGVLILSAAWLLDTQGMESSLFLALAAASLMAYLADGEIAVGISLGLLTLTRGDGAILAFILGTAWIIGKRQLPLRMVGAGLAILAPWAIYGQISLGHFLPDTLDAKAAQGASGLWGHGHLFLSGFVSIPDMFRFSSWWWTVFAFGCFGFFQVTTSDRYRRFLLPLVIFMFVYVIVYDSLFHVPAYHWYYSLPVYTILCFAAAGIVQLVRIGHSRRERFGPLLGVAGFVASVYLGLWQTVSGFPWPPYLAVANWLVNNTPPTATVASADIGIIGWYSGRPIIDFLGLLSQQDAADLRRGDVLSWILRTPPDYFVAHVPPYGAEAPVLAQRWFPLAYEQVYSNEHTILYRRMLTPQLAMQHVDDRFNAQVAAAAKQVSEAGVNLLDAQSINALRALLRVYLSRPDLQRVYGPPDHLNLSGLSNWGAAAGLTIDSSRPSLLSQENGIRLLASVLGRSPPIVVTIG